MYDHRKRHSKIVDLLVFRGYLGITTFRHILQDPRTQNIPLILETPSFEQPLEVWGKEIEILQMMASSPETEKSEEDLQEEVRNTVKDAESRSRKTKRVSKSTKATKRKAE